MVKFVHPLNPLTAHCTVCLFSHPVNKQLPTVSCTSPPNSTLAQPYILHRNQLLYLWKHSCTINNTYNYSQFSSYHSTYTVNGKYRIASNFRGTKYLLLRHFVGNIFVVAACTAGKGRQGRFIRG